MPVNLTFDRFKLLSESRQLLLDGQSVSIGARAFDLLLALIEHRERLVTKEELLDLVWPGLVVEENNLQVQVSVLRKILGAQSIATVPGRGYRFTMPVKPGDVSGVSASAIVETPQLFGRADDLSALRDLIDREKLVTIVGPAGIGKTRLAHAAMHDLSGQFAERVLVDLAPIADPALVAVTMARALGIAIGDARFPLDLAVQVLADQRLLIVLDNCEHLLEAVDHLVVALRKGAPKVHILATSQEVLRHPDEHVYRLGILALPIEPTVSSARQAGAVELFIARTQAVVPGFVLSDDNVTAVIEVCRRLDGIPLAIELAAARVPLLGIEGVRERLDERFRLLTAGSRLALRRHQTLRAALEWSYGLLSESEKEVFEKVGVFAGSFSLESAQRLAAEGEMDQWDVLDHLGALVDKSLVTVEGSWTARYRMLETTRAFALERLAARGMTAHMMRRHAEVMLELFEHYFGEVLQGTPSMMVTERIALDLDNLWSALRWAGETGGDRRIAIALFGAAVAGHGYFYYAALRARPWIEKLRPLVDASLPKDIVARFWLACAGWSSVHSPAAAVDDARSAIALYHDLDDRLGTCRGWMLLTLSLINTGQVEEGRQALQEVLGLCDPEWPLWHRALVDNSAVLAYMNLGELDEARRRALALLAACREVSGDVDECLALSLLIDINVATGNLREAATAGEMLTQHPALWKPTEDGRSLRSAATALMNVDRLDEAEPLYREALSRLRRSYGSAAVALYDVTMYVARRRRIDDAARLFAYAERTYDVQGIRPRLVARQIRDDLLALLAAERPADTLSRLYDEGRRLTEAEVGALVFPIFKTGG